LRKPWKNTLRSAGKILSEVDAQGRQMPNYENKRIDPQDGLNVVLTIDENIQYFAEEALQKAIEDNKVANGAFAIVMDPETEKFWRWYQNLILISTIQSLPPSEDPATWTGTSQKDVETLYRTVWRNKAVSDTYEPGSTFKAITTAIGFEEGL